MDTWAALGMVALFVVVPQVVGFAASRIGRRLPAGLWPLAASATIAVYWAILAVHEHRAAERALAAGEFRCGTGEMAAYFALSILLVGHLVVGGLLDTLDRRARRF